jgi:hypothetical protein
VASLLYPDTGDRTYADLDLLVDRRQFPKAVDLLEGLGYEHAVHDWALAEAVLAGQIGMKSPILHVDLHWHLHFSRDDRRQFAIDPVAMVGRARRVKVSSLTVPTFDSVDTLLTLGFHAARSDGHRLVWLKDVERAVTVDQPDLDELVRRCLAYRCGPPVGLVLGRARWLLGTEVPDEIIRALTPPTLRAADRLVCRIKHPIQFDEHETITRLFTRSVRSSVSTSVQALPERSARWVQRTLHPTRWSETDDADEKASYLHAVATASEV